MSIKRIIGAIITMGLLTIGTSISQAPSASAYTGQPVFFFTPHQDDEALFMGAAIKQHVDAGRKVWVVLLTDGGSSGMCEILYPGDRAACVAARDAEFIAGVKSLGAIPIIRADRVRDGALTVAYAKSVINNYYTNVNYRLASYKTMSETDDHPDHANLGKGLRQSNATDKRWYIKTSQWSTHAGVFTPSYDLTATLALYPFGHLSVPSMFATAATPYGARSKAYS